MKITKSQLKQIIKEELESALQSQPRKIPRLLRPVAEYFQNSVEGIQSVVTDLELEESISSLKDLQALLPNGADPIDYHILFTDAMNVSLDKRDEHRSARIKLRKKLLDALVKMNNEFIRAMQQNHISKEEWQQIAVPNGKGLVSQFLVTMMNKAIQHPDPAHFRDIVIKEELEKALKE